MSRKAPRARESQDANACIIKWQMEVERLKVGRIQQHAIAIGQLDIDILENEGKVQHVEGVRRKAALRMLVIPPQQRRN